MGNGPAIDGDEEAFGERELMDSASDDFFAGSGFAEDQDRAIFGGSEMDPLLDLLGRGVRGKPVGGKGRGGLGSGSLDNLGEITEGKIVLKELAGAMGRC